VKTDNAFDAAEAEFNERVRSNQARLSAGLKAQYDFIVCGSGSSGSVVARRLAENPEVNVLLLEAGGDDDVASIREAASWPTNLGGEYDWNFTAQANPSINGRSLPLSMGKVLGGGSSINLMIWARGHKNDWDFFAEEAAIPHGTMIRSFGSIVGSKTGTGRQTRSIAVLEDPSMCSPGSLPVRKLLPYLKEHGALASQPMRTRTAD